MKKWSNLIRDIVPSHPDEVWVSDITYIEIVQGVKRTFMYLSLITDAYTHEVVGYALHDTLDTTGPLKALGMALAKHPVGTLKGLIHHSDRGSQYCCQEYVNKLQQHGILISMTDKGDPYENAIAERVNGILKTEWLYCVVLKKVYQKKVNAAPATSLINQESQHSAGHDYRYRTDLEEHCRDHCRPEQRPALPIREVFRDNAHVQTRKHWHACP